MLVHQSSYKVGRFPACLEERIPLFDETRSFGNVNRQLLCRSNGIGIGPSRLQMRQYHRPLRRQCSQIQRQSLEGETDVFNRCGNGGRRGRGSRFFGGDLLRWRRRSRRRRTERCKGLGRGSTTTRRGCWPQWGGRRGTTTVPCGSGGATRGTTVRHRPRHRHDRFRAAASYDGCGSVPGPCARHETG